MEQESLEAVNIAWIVEDRTAEARKLAVMEIVQVKRTDISLHTHSLQPIATVCTCFKHTIS